MGYIYLFFVSVVFSFGGTLVKTASVMVNSTYISFMRFFVGAVFLLLFLTLRKNKIQLRFYWPVFLGAACKCLNYITENYCLENGFSFGNILVRPVQCVAALALSYFIFSEKASPRKIAGVFLCCAGVVIISLNGQPLSAFGGENLLFTILYILSGIGASGFTFAQKLLINRMDSANMNLSMFTVAAVITALPIPVTGEIYTGFQLPAFLALVAFGLVSGVCFLLVAEAIKTVPLFMVELIQSITVPLSLLWGILFYNEPVTSWIIGGTVVFLIGMLAVNLKLPAKIKTT